MTTDKKKFYYKDKFFDTEKDFFDYVIQWNNEKLSEESFNKLFDDLKRDIWINIAYLDLKNCDATIVLSEMFYHLVKYFREGAELYKNTEMKKNDT